MKYINVLLVIIGITIGIISVSSRSVDLDDQNCHDEEALLRRQFNGCGPSGFTLFDIIDSIVEYRNNTKTSAEFLQYQTEYCQKLQSAVDCLLELTSRVSSACRQTTPMQPPLNIMRIIKKLQSDFCTRTILFEMANDRGFDCLQNLETLDCRPKNIANAGHPMEDQNVCSFARASQTCFNTGFDDCEHDGFIKKYANQMVKSVIQDFSCA